MGLTLIVARYTNLNPFAVENVYSVYHVARFCAGIVRNACIDAKPTMTGYMTDG